MTLPCRLFGNLLRGHSESASEYFLIHRLITTLKLFRATHCFISIKSSEMESVGLKCQSAILRLADGDGHFRDLAIYLFNDGLPL